MLALKKNSGLGGTGVSVRRGPAHTFLEFLFGFQIM